MGSDICGFGRVGTGYWGFCRDWGYMTGERMKFGNPEMTKLERTELWNCGIDPGSDGRVDFGRGWGWTKRRVNG